MGRGKRRWLLVLLLLVSLGLLVWGLLPAERAVDVMPLGPQIPIPTPTGWMWYGGLGVV